MITLKETLSSIVSELKFLTTKSKVFFPHVKFRALIEKEQDPKNWAEIIWQILIKLRTWKFQVPLSLSCQ